MHSTIQAIVSGEKLFKFHTTVASVEDDAFLSVSTSFDGHGHVVVLVAAVLPPYH